MRKETLQILTGTYAICQPCPHMFHSSLKRLEGRLMLDEETAAKFAPLYKEYLEALRNCPAVASATNN